MEEKETNKLAYIFTEREQDGLYSFLAFFVWPFGVLVSTLSNWRKPWSKNVFWLFCVFFGLTFIIASEGEADSDRYARLFLSYAKSNMDISELMNSFYAEGGSFVDVASPLITYLVSRFTDKPAALFAVFGMIFGYFYSRNIWFLLGKVKGNLTAISILFLFTFAIINPIWNINGFRMWTAAQIFLFGTLQYLVNGKKSGLVWSCCSVLFHFSFLFSLGILVIYIFLQNRVTLYFSLFIATSFIKEIDLVWMRSLLMFLPDIFHTKVANYTSVGYAESLNEMHQAINWYVPFSQVALKMVVYAGVIYVFTRVRASLKMLSGLENLFCYGMLLYAASNIFSFIPSGYRFIHISNTFIISFLFIFINVYNNYKGIGVLKKISVPMLGFYAVVVMRMGMDYYGLMTVMGNPIVAIIQKVDVPLIDVVKGLL
ncbi:hypothetical protein E9993_08890 [Labilibacter sediminis]|nr:hypothetical protein E9993_08890 [Labilibacter sediminis]